ncbi:MAG: hypothetical protein IT285_04495 [Bdellovibrionales bacterium]|nr:hypothetical protein [Bdellovibrionales bacterium]
MKTQILAGSVLGPGGEERGLNHYSRFKINQHYEDTGAMNWKPKFSKAVINVAPPLINACSLVPIPPLNIPSEGGQIAPGAASTNHLGKTCGDFCSITVKVDVEIGCNAVFDLPPWECDMKPKYPKITITPETQLPLCRREESLLRGAFMQIIECNRAKVAEEISGAGIIDITTDVPGTDGACAELARNSLSFHEEQNVVISDLLTNFTSANELAARMDACRIGLSANTDPGDSEEPMTLVPCYLAGARAAIASAFTAVALCEVHARARRMFQRNFTDPGPDNLLKSIIDGSGGIMETCAQQCGNASRYESCKPNFGNVVSAVVSDGLNALTALEKKAEECAENEANPCARDCYRSELMSRLSS